MSGCLVVLLPVAQDPQHRGTIPLVEIALALMRLSTEKYFVLLSLYVAFILFRTPPRHAAALVAFNARVSGAFARLILYTFPAVCWVYGAGFIFSTFVSGVELSCSLLRVDQVCRCFSARLACQATSSTTCEGSW